jgi:hypothetical protein
VPVLSVTLTQERRLILIRKALSVFFLAGIAFSFPLWTSDRFFPVVPLLVQIRDAGFPLEFFFLLTLLVSLLVSIFSTRKSILFLIMLSATVLMVYDQMRWQPWVYLYLLIIAAFLLAPRAGDGKSILINYLQIILTGVYFWSGIHKINPGFIDHTYRDILTHLLHIPNQNISKLLLFSGYVIPVIEIVIGIALWFPHFRDKAVAMAVGSHIFILLFLSPLGINGNSVVYPWNLAMIAFVILLFRNEKNQIGLWPAALRQKICLVYFTILIWVLPATNFFGLWDDYLSFSLYSDKASEYYIAIEENETAKIDGRLKRFFVHLPGITGGRLIDVNAWAMNDLGVPFYPERRVFKKIAAIFCEKGIEKGKIIFLEFKHPFQSGAHHSFTCEDPGTE